ncbi:MAG: DnaB-like helicase N-terminal domain-containing protein, partial [Patescibacteria group bacterium]|nr:DnaB-like helicase N-terminal domain-containing protein [Patescibacteria group bacterium]
MTTQIERIPPQNLEAEQSLLGSLLIDKDAIIRVADTVSPEDFYKDTHRTIYDAMVELYKKREPIDLLSLGNKLEEKKKLEEIGGKTYLVSLSNTIATASNAKHYGQIIQKKASLRRLISAAGDITQLGYEETEDVESLLDKAEQKLFSVSQKYLKQLFVPIRNILDEAFERIDELHKERGKLRGTATGFAQLDSMLAGLQKSDLIILAARPSIGKT